MNPRFLIHPFEEDGLATFFLNEYCSREGLGAVGTGLAGAEVVGSGAAAIGIGVGVGVSEAGAVVFDAGASVVGCGWASFGFRMPCVIWVDCCLLGFSLVNCWLIMVKTCVAS